MSSEFPEWLNNEFLQKILVSDEELTNSIEVKNFSIKMAVGKGENYICRVYRVKVTYKTSEDNYEEEYEMSLIIKAPNVGPVTEFLEKLDTKYNIIHKEELVYNELIPKLKLIFNENDDTSIFAKSFPSTEENVIVLEDLNFKGYVMGDRLKQLNLEETISAIKALAKFHAGTVKLHEQEPELIEKIGVDAVFDDGLKGVSSEFVTVNFKIFTKICKDNPDIEKYSDFFDNFSEHCWEILSKCVKREENDFNVLNHGDFWVNNMLFKYDNHVISNVKLIDLQLCRYTSPVIDILYFMYGSVQEQVLNENYDQVLDIYLCELNKTLGKLGSSKRLKEAEFKKSLYDRRIFSLYASLTIFPGAMADPNEIKILDFGDTDLNVDSFKNVENNPVKPYLENKKFIKAIGNRLKKFEKDGFVKSKIKIVKQFPEWINKDFIKKTLENDKKTSKTIQVEYFDINMAVAKGNNYASDIYRVKVKYKTSEDDYLKEHETSLIIKSPIKGPSYEEILKMGILQKEVLVYNELIPKLNLIFHQNDDESIFSKSLMSTEEYVIVLEDLNFKGYVMVDRMKQLNFEESVAALKSLAKFHAGSVKLYEQEPELIKIIGKEPCFTDEFKESNNLYVENTFKSFARICLSNPKIEKYSYSFEHLSKDAWDIITSCFQIENGFNVLNHGDFWVTNMLFKYENGIPTNVKLIDLQMCRYTSPVIDLINFMHGSVQEKVRTENHAQLYQVYLDELNKNLEKFGSLKRLTEPEFKSSLNRRKMFALIACLTILPGTLANPDTTKIIDWSEETRDSLKDVENSPMYSYLENKNYIKIMEKRLNEFEKDGLITSRKEMDAEDPKWLTDEFIKKILQQEEISSNNEIKVERIDLKLDSETGNNYTSKIYRLGVKYKISEDEYKKEQEISLVVKVPKEGDLFDTIKSQGFYKKEERIYKELSPKIQKVFGEDYNVLPKSYLSTEEDFIIMQDLNTKGYVLADRLKLLNFEECVAALKSLAKFHATVVKLHEQEPELIESIGEEAFFRNELKETNNKYLMGSFCLFSEVCKANPEIEKYAEFFETFSKECWDIILNCVKPDEKNLNVLNHGDFWVNNMLFKYADDKPCDVKLIDLQLCRYASPVLDVLYFMYGSVQEEVLTENYEQLLKVYLNELNSNLEIVGSLKRLNESDYNEALNKRKSFIFFVLVILVPMVIADPNEIEIVDFSEQNFENFEDNSKNPMKNYFENKKYLQIMAKRLKELEKDGLIKIKSNIDEEFPEWLNKEFIQKVLESDEGSSDSIVVESIAIKMAVAKGDNYASNVYRIEVRYKMPEEEYQKEHKTSLIIKAPIEGPMREMMCDTGVYKKEISAYNILSPKFQEIIGKNSENMIPKSYSSNIENVVVLEDLNYKGYVMADRLKQLNVEQCLIALTSLAKFHACTVILHEKEPELIEKIGNEVFFCEDLRETFSKTAENFFKMFSNACKDNPEIERYADFFDKLSVEGFDVIAGSFKCDKNGFNVLNHGDFWVNNMLFKYENEKLTDVKLIDLQICRYGSPAIDFLYFMCGSVQEKVRIENHEQLLRHYLKELNEYLEQFGSIKRLSELEFKKLLKEKVLYAIFSSISILPFVIAKPNETKIMDLSEATIDNFNDAEKNPMKEYLKNKDVIKIVAKRLEEFENDGLITI